MATVKQISTIYLYLRFILKEVTDFHLFRFATQTLRNQKPACPLQLLLSNDSLLHCHLKVSPPYKHVRTEMCSFAVSVTQVKESCKLFTQGWL